MGRELAMNLAAIHIGMFIRHPFPPSLHAALGPIHNMSHADFGPIVNGCLAKFIKNLQIIYQLFSPANVKMPTSTTRPSLST
jgi:hypothetical protein